MKIQILLVFFWFIMCQSAFPQNKDIEELTKLNKDWLNSYQTKDTATLNKILANDFILISPNGTKMTRDDVINNITKQEPVSVNIDSIDVLLLTPDVGLITAYTTFIIKKFDKEHTGKNCYQDVYMKRKNRWYAVAAHVTLLNMK